MSDLITEEMVLELREPILANFHPPTDKWGSRHIHPDEMARAVLAVAAPAIAAKAWAEGHATPWVRDMDDCGCNAWNRSECACGKYGTGRLITPNPYEVKA